MKIEWIVSGLTIDGLGISREGETVNASKTVGENLINQGIAKAVRSPKKEKVKEDN